ncbi:MAG: hypothetical protein KKH67_12140 [candidate division Zixibacteria bacterium]|nr:hypothetical protein [candidate division Zixibacteria bacterium]MBU1471087.1 hypothetical protein [candidate division Zixibacteria bacterium]
MDKHITIIGILYIVFGVLGLLAAGVILVVIAGSGLVSGDPEAMAITSIVAIAVSGFLAIISVPGIIGGIFLLKRKPWARIFVLVLGFLNLIDLPFGTALGIYTIWALMNDETIRLFGQGIAVVPSTN